MLTPFAILTILAMANLFATIVGFCFAGHYPASVLWLWVGSTGLLLCVVDIIIAIEVLLGETGIMGAGTILLSLVPFLFMGIIWAKAFVRGRHREPVRNAASSLDRYADLLRYVQDAILVAGPGQDLLSITLPAGKLDAPLNQVIPWLVGSLTLQWEVSVDQPFLADRPAWFRLHLVRRHGLLDLESPPDDPDLWERKEMQKRLFRAKS